MLREIKNNQNFEKKGDKFFYTQERVVELDAEEILKLATNERLKIEEGTKEISNIKNKMRTANDFLSRNKKLIEEAGKKTESQFCEKCGMDFFLPVNKDMNSKKTKEPYKCLCKNCAVKEGL